MEEWEASYRQYTPERTEPVRAMQRALFNTVSPDREDLEEREALYQRRTPQHVEPVGNRRRQPLSVRPPDIEDSDEPSSGFETIITRRRVETTTSTTSNGTT
jgi:hypothetical protein